MYNPHWQEELKNHSPKMKDIIKVENYLYDNFNNFYDRKMVQLHNEREKNICLEMEKALLTYDIIVNEERLLKWAKMCMNLENIPTDICKDIALRNKLRRLQLKVNGLEKENAQLRRENRKLKEVLAKSYE